MANQRFFVTMRCNVVGISQPRITEKGQYLSIMRVSNRKTYFNKKTNEWVRTSPQYITVQVFSFKESDIPCYDKGTLLEITGFVSYVRHDYVNSKGISREIRNYDMTAYNIEEIKSKTGKNTINKAPETVTNEESTEEPF